MQLRLWFWHIVAFTSYLFCRLRLRIAVRQHGPPPEGPVLLCATHGSGLDIPLLANWCRWLRKFPPYFQMGSFIGYRTLGPLVPALRRLGGFCVMRPKEALRLRRTPGWPRERVRSVMTSLNEKAEETRSAVLRSSGTLVVFPEGTRDDLALLPLVSELEVQTAAKLVKEGLEVMVWPATISYGTRRLFRRPVIIDLLQPFPVGDQNPHEILGLVREQFEKNWIPPEMVDELGPKTPRHSTLGGAN